MLIRITCFGLLLAAVLLLGWRLTQLRVPEPLDQATTGSSIPVRHKTLPVFELQAIERYTQTTHRPLFWKSRRPLNTSSSAVARGEPVDDDVPYILRAVIIVGERREVLLLDEIAGESHRRREGEQVGDWTVEKIRAGKVVLRQNELTRELELRSFDPDDALLD